MTPVVPYASLRLCSTDGAQYLHHNVHYIRPCLTTSPESIPIPCADLSKCASSTAWDKGRAPITRFVLYAQPWCSSRTRARYCCDVSGRS
jgi:hypothetical protein